MNNPSPLLPQGATPPRAKSSLYFKVLMILTVHVVVIGGMLLQGCKDTGKDQTKADGSAGATADTTAMAPANPTAAPTSAAPTTDVPATVNPGIGDAYAGKADSAAPAAPSPSPALSPSSAPAGGLVSAPKSTDLAPPAEPGESKEYVIAKGDTLGAIAHRNGLSLKVLMEANPGVDSRKLRIGQKVQIPAAVAALAATAATGATPGATADAAPGEATVYVVKSGDMLLKIAKAHRTSVKKIMAMNDLKTTSIRAGQKLKLPAPKVSSSEPAATSASASVVQPPARVSALAPAATAPVAAN